VLTAGGLTLLLAGVWPVSASRVLAEGTIALTGGPYTQDFNGLSAVGGQCATATLDLRADVPTSPTTTLPPPGTLPATGSNLGTPAGVAAVAALGAGALLLGASRRTSNRRRRPVELDEG
jgi:hypothetical protein